jgi:hypothetical protein
VLRQRLHIENVRIAWTSWVGTEATAEVQWALGRQPRTTAPRGARQGEPVSPEMGDTQ